MRFGEFLLLRYETLSVYSCFVGTQYLPTWDYVEFQSAYFWVLSVCYGLCALFTVETSLKFSSVRYFILLPLNPFLLTPQVYYERVSTRLTRVKINVPECFFFNMFRLLYKDFFLIVRFNALQLIIYSRKWKRLQFSRNFTAISPDGKWCQMKTTA